MKKALKVIGLFFLSLIVILMETVGGLFILSRFKIDQPASGYDWNETTTFDLNLHTTSLEVEDDYQVLFLTDIHYFGYFERRTENYITKLVAESEPDLIILVGDNTFTPFNKHAMTHLIELIDSFKTPWTLVFGNHDDFGRASKDYMANQILTSTYAIFTYGPNDFGGNGNQIINLVHDEHIIHSFILLDTVRNGAISPPITLKQISWYEWAIKGLQLADPETLATSVVTHVALPEMVDAYQNGLTIAGFQGEKVSLMKNNGLYDKIVELGSTKYLFHGHDHYNNNITLYNGIYFTYVMQVGVFTYGYQKKGGTLFTIMPTGETQFKLVYAN